MSLGPRSRRRSCIRIAVALLALVVLAGCSTWRAASLYHSGTRALEAGRVEEALSDLDEAARLAPQASEIRNHLGLAWLAAGDEERALEAFERAVALDCDNRAAVRNLEALEAGLQERAIERVSR